MAGAHAPATSVLCPSFPKEARNPLGEPTTISLLLHKPRFLGRRPKARSDEFLVLIRGQIPHPLHVSRLIGMNLLPEGIALL